MMSSNMAAGANNGGSAAMHEIPPVNLQRLETSTLQRYSAAPRRVWATDITASLSQNGEIHASKPVHCRRAFESDASIVLIGMQGSGKSTLAVIASGACRKRVVDMESLFQEATGFSTAKYRKQFGASNHMLRQEEILRNALQTYDKGAILVCNGTSLERTGQTLLEEFSRTHPVIHIVRDLRSIHQYLEVVDMSKLQGLVEFSGPLFRRCSNYEFYNLTENKAPSCIAPANQPSVPVFLTLKRTERAFLNFLSLITTTETGQGKLGSLEADLPLSEVATELRNHTCAVQAPLAVLQSEDVDIEEIAMGSDAFEIVVDPGEVEFTPPGLPSDRADLITRVIARVRRVTVVPIIYHVIPVPEQDPRWTSYLEHVFHGLRSAPDFLTVDMSLDDEAIAEVVRVRGSTKIIGHMHSPLNWSNTFWVQKCDAAVRLGCTVVRFTRPAQFMDDRAMIQCFRNNIKQHFPTTPLICFNTGRAGRQSACFNSVLTSVIPPSLRESDQFSALVERNLETSWLTIDEATHALYATFTHEPMKFYIIGASDEHNISSAMHNAAFEACCMPHTFQNIQTSNLSRLQDLVRDTTFGGTAITRPFKIEVISLTHSLSKHARAIGAVNTLIPVRHLNEDGSIPDALGLFKERNQAGTIKALYGDNTDWIGIRACIRRGLSPANAVCHSTCGLVLGAGSMARAAVYALLKLGVRNILIYNRTLANAENLVNHFTRLVSFPNTPFSPSITTSNRVPAFRILNSKDDPWPADLPPPTIILSCAPIDAMGDSLAPDFTLPKQWLLSPTGGVIVEVAYRTLDDPLTEEVREKAGQSWVCFDGLDVLLEQGFAQFELFTGKRAPRRIMREAVLSSVGSQGEKEDQGIVRSRLDNVVDLDP